MQLLPIAAIVLLKLPAAVAADDSASCQCQPLGPPSYIVTRLWDIVQPESWSDQEVIDEFDAGFAPLVTGLEGFQRYTAATTGNSSTVFFMNAFDSAEHAVAAQTAAKDFVENGALKGAISPNQFTEDEVIYGFPDEGAACITEPSVGQFLSTRLFRWKDPASVTTEQLVVAGGSFNSKVKDLDGYVTYVGTLSLDRGDTFVYNIYDSEESADMANSMGSANAANNTAEVPPNDLVVSTKGSIVFDYLCAAGNAPSATDDEEEQDGKETGESCECLGPGHPDLPSDSKLEEFGFPTGWGKTCQAWNVDYTSPSSATCEEGGDDYGAVWCTEPWCYVSANNDCDPQGVWTAEGSGRTFATAACDGGDEPDEDHNEDHKDHDHNHDEGTDDKDVLPVDAKESEGAKLFASSYILGIAAAALAVF